MFRVISLFAILIATPVIGVAETMGDLVKREGRYYSVRGNELFTGVVSGPDRGSFKEGQRLGEEVAKTTQVLKWVDEDSVGFNSLKLERSGNRSNTFVHDSSGSSVYLNDKERPYLLVFTQPQTWMNKFGYLRVSFFRCSGETA